MTYPGEFDDELADTIEAERRRRSAQSTRHVTDNGGGIVWASQQPSDDCETKLVLAHARIARLERLLANNWTTLPLYNMDTVKKLAR